MASLSSVSISSRATIFSKNVQRVSSSMASRSHKRHVELSIIRRMELLPISNDFTRTIIACTQRYKTMVESSYTPPFSIDEPTRSCQNEQEGPVSCQSLFAQKDERKPGPSAYYYQAEEASIVVANLLSCSKGVYIKLTCCRGYIGGTYSRFRRSRDIGRLLSGLINLSFCCGEQQALCSL